MAVSEDLDVADWRDDILQSFTKRVAKARAAIDSKRADHDATNASRLVEAADSRALYAIDVAYSAVLEAEFAILDAQLARMEVTS